MKAAVKSPVDKIAHVSLKVLHNGTSEFGKAFIVERSLAVVGLDGRIVLALMITCACYALFTIIHEG